MRFVQIFAVVLVLGFSGADVAAEVNQTNNFSSRITNGFRAGLGEFPWHALLAIQYRNDPANAFTFFNGVILNNLWILTTADALVDARSIRADIGHVYINRPSLSLYPDWFIMHPQYNPNRFVNNIGLVRMPVNRPITFPSGPNPSYWPIRLPTLRQQHATFEGSEGYFTGWGMIRPHDRNISEYLSFADQRVISNIECVRAYGLDAELISPKVVCAMSRNNGQGPCNGDGGGPLVINEFGSYTLIGILSFLHGTGSCGRQPAPAAFTRLTSHFDWIGRTTGYQFRP